MFQPLYEEVVRFASEGELGEELVRAKAEFVHRTGEMFETDESFERRIGAFLEWYTLDRKISFKPDSTPIEHYLTVATVSEESRPRLGGLTRTHLSLFEFKRAKKEILGFVDLLTGEKVEVFERRKPAGLESGDILEARTVPYDDKLLFADAYGVHPREARKAIAKACKKFRKDGGGVPLDLVHRVAYLTNRCERYKHVDPLKIFAELEAPKAA